MSLANQLRSRMQVLPAHQAKQYGGAVNFDWSTAGPGYPCDLQPVSATKRVTLLQLGIDPTHELYFDPRAVELDSEDRVKVGAKTYKVLTLEKPASQRPGWPAKALLMEARI